MSGKNDPAPDNSLSGIIIDNETGETIPFAYLHLEEIHRQAVTDANGNFEINNIPAGEYTLTIHRLGYKTTTLKVSVGLDEKETPLTIKLSPSLLSSQAIEVTGEDMRISGSSLEHASRKFLGTDLRRDLGSTLSQTLANMPGFDQRTMGSAPGRPVIRGLGDERVVILQDGISSGDVSAQSSDHAVTIDPVSAQEIEVARGPAALQYGANAIGGVINVVRNQIATSVPSKINGSFTANGETVSTGASAALNVSIPIQQFVITTDFNGRLAGDTRTPLGRLSNSYFRTTNDAIGISMVKDWGYVGGSLGTYVSNYGIPPDPNGHPEGVDIEMSKFQYVGKSEIILNNEFFRTLEFDLSLNNYNHKEIEASGDTGTEFGLVSTNFNGNLTHKKIGFLDEGKIGVSARTEDYAVAGAGTPASNSYLVGVFVIEEKDLNYLHIEAGLRFDWVQNAPKEDDSDSRIGNIRTRSFSALSSSVSLIYSLSPSVTLGTTFLHSFRAPSLEELYSSGPHLASYSYEIGNPELDPERGLAKELFIRYKGNKSVVELTGFHNGFSNYLYAENTGRINSRFPNLLDYQFVGEKATMYGFEVSYEQQLIDHWMVKTSSSYTYAYRKSVTDSGRFPLEQIPPLKGTLGLTYSNKKLETGTRIRAAAEQNRTGEFETPTDGYVIADLFSQYRFSSQKLLHTISLNISNLLDDEYYNHLSRIKDFNPEAGRNVSLLYRVYF